MSNSADLELVRHIPITYELRLVHASFNIMCSSLRLPPMPATLHDFQPRQLQLLANILLNALLLALPTTNPLRASLSTLASSIISSSSAANRMKPLVEAAIPYHADTMLVWNLVLREIAHTRASTPLQPVGPPAKKTATPAPTVPHGPPDTKDDESEQRIQRVRENFQKETFKEIQGCTFLGVGGFFEKFFEGKDWTGRAQGVYESLKSQHVSNMWIHLGVSPGITGMMTYLHSLQEHFLKGEDRQFREVTLPSELTEGFKGQRLDLCVRQKCGELLDSLFEWKDMMVIGQLTVERGIKKRLVQLACYARHLFDYQPTRRYLHAFTLRGSELEPWVFDRSGCYSPGAFNIHQHPERFVRVIAGYIMMSQEDLGLDTFVQQEEDSRFIRIVGPGGKRSRLHLSPALLAHRPTIVSRATSCFLAKHAGSTDHDRVVKFSWPFSNQRSEVDILEIAKQRGVEGIVRLDTHCEITSINDIRRGMTFGKRYTFDDTGSGMPTSSHAKFPSQLWASKRSRTSESPAGQSKKRKSTEEDLDLRRPKKDSGPDRNRAYNGDIASHGSYDNRIFRCLIISPPGRPI
ncbi:hypothetical protein CCMA1212_001427 [Trichoderma ghanense]|uniref:Fungal-type protein kinase domain-containing protein n=1 Tax=Trichoderma ghanense TaxID=65468 RepID=A0ABY2HGQ6_9HYPO